MAGKKIIANYLSKIYNRLYAYFGPQYWWPAESAFEVIIGAILTQNTAWPNVEKAISRLKEKKLISPQKLYNSKVENIAEAIRPAGYYNIKAERIKSFLQVLFGEFQGNLCKMLSLRTRPLRERLLRIKGIGPETADSILLYAAKRPVFVVDAYTQRFLLRHRVVSKEADYQQIQSLFEKNLPRNPALFNEYHALIVRLGKEFCRLQPRCGSCPLGRDKSRLKRRKKWK